MGVAANGLEGSWIVAFLENPFLAEYAFKTASREAEKNAFFHQNNKNRAKAGFVSV